MARFTIVISWIFHLYPHLFTGTFSGLTEYNSFVVISQRGPYGLSYAQLAGLSCEQLHILSIAQNITKIYSEQN